MENKLYEYVKCTRGVGHTRLLMDGAINAQYPYFVVGADLSHAKQLIRETGGNTFAIPISLTWVQHDNFRCYKHPVLIDNYTFTVTCESYMTEIRKLKESLTTKEEQLKHNKEVLEKIKQLPFFIRLFKPLYLRIITRNTNNYVQ
jgi:hypothetical protein